MSPTKQGDGIARVLGWALALLLAICAGVAQAATIQYVYDELGRLIAEIDPGSDTTRYTYDAAGNLLSVSRGSSAQLTIVSLTPDSETVGRSTILIMTVHKR